MRVRDLAAAESDLDDALSYYALHRFPYGIVYRVGHDEILIVAYAHFKRRPGFWKNRG